MKTVLSIDGGGIRGLIPAVVCAQIEKETGKSISALFDLVVGTSTGGILSLGLCLPSTTGKPKNSAQEMIKMYVEEGPTIFKKRKLDDLDEWLLGEAKYDSSGIDGALAKYFGDVPISQCLTNVMATGYDVTARSTCFFKSWDNQFNSFDCRQVARATSAAPTYFEPEKLLDSNSKEVSCIDGGVTANNPALSAFVEALHHKETEQEEILVISLGTGSYEKSYSFAEVSHWRPVQWLLPMIDFFFDASSMAVDYQMKVLQKTRVAQYHRFQTALAEDFDSIDDASKNNIERLQQCGSRIFQTEQKSEFEKMISDLINAQPTRTVTVWDKKARVQNVG